MDSMIAKLKEKKVILRSDQSGVWYGTLQDAKLIEGTGGYTVTVTVTDGVKVHYWTGAAATSGLAVTGPGEGSRLCPEVDIAVVRDCCEVLLATSKAIEKFASLDRWEP